MSDWHKPSIPQQDDNPERRAEEVASGREEYAWDHDRHPPLAFVKELPSSEKQGPSYLASAAGPVVEAFLNTAAIRSGDGASPKPPTGIGDTIDEMKKMSKGYTGRYASIEEFDELYQVVDRPAIADRWDTDATFAEMRVAGPSPAHIRRCDELPDAFPVGESHYTQAGLGEGDSLEAARKEGRLYLLDYDLLAQGRWGRFENNPKSMGAPYALFALPRGDAGTVRSLAPVAIQIGRIPGPNNEIFTPAHGLAWLMAKTGVQVADSTWHEMVAHLGLTHMVMESIGAAAKRNFAEHHPVRRLLDVHVEGTLYINDIAAGGLINDGGSVDRALTFEIASTKAVTANALARYDFNAGMLPQDLADRGVLDPDLAYPYRDDARLLWDAILTWVGSYVTTHYPDDAAVAGDWELQAFGADVVSAEGGRLNGVGDAGDGRFATRDYLTKCITHAVFTGSAQHAAVNFPQASIMSYPPLYPGAGYREAPRTVADAQRFDLVDMLPGRAAALSQWQMLFGLGSVYHTQLGDYGVPWRLRDKQVGEALDAFSARLEGVEATINEANQTRPITYTELLPSKVPQAINI